jgi:hypothetical protein
MAEAMSASIGLFVSGLGRQARSVPCRTTSTAWTLLSFASCEARNHRHDSQWFGARASTE